MDTSGTQSVIAGFIFARGGSKGLPGKNIRPLHGKPLLAWTIERARETGLFTHLVLSTDDPDIASVGRQYGAEVPFVRPAALAADDSPEWLAWQHAIAFMRDNGKPFDVFVSLPAVSPLRSSEDIIGCVNLYLENRQDTDFVITCTKSNHHPGFNMISLDENDSTAQLAMSLPGAPRRRQDAPPIYNIATVCYVSSPDFILNNSGIFDGRVRAFMVPEERAVDIDTPFDFAFAEFLWAQKNSCNS